MNKILFIINNRVCLVLIFIVLLAGLIRFYKLADIPVSLYWDEVATGYNAFSIADNLKDEYGNFMPILFRSYNDYKMPLNVYLTAASVKIFGLNEFSVRFPSALFGTATVAIVFFLVQKLFSFKKTKYKYLNANVLAILSSFLLSISPWHIQFSRAGFEANIALFFIILGAYLFLKGLFTYKYFLFSFFSFALAFYGYRSTQIFLPFFIIGLFLVWKKEILNLGLKKLLVGLIFFLILISPLIVPLAKEGSSRFQQTSISIQVNEEAIKDYQKGISSNRKLLYARVFLENYLAEFSPQFLFISGDQNGRHSPRGMGLLYLWEIPFLVLGFYVLVRKFAFKVSGTVFVWLLASPIASALSIPDPHALRSLNLLPIPQIITALGVFYLAGLLPKNFLRIYVGTMVVIICLFFVNYIKLYNLSNTKLVVSDWGDGYKQLITYINKNENKYDRIIISGHYWQPYMYELFYKQYDPEKFQLFGSSQQFDKYIFGGTSWDLNVGKPELNRINLKEFAHSSNVLVALSPEEYKDQVQNISVNYKIKDHNGKTVFIVGNLK